MKEFGALGENGKSVKTIIYAASKPDSKTVLSLAMILASTESVSSCANGNFDEFKNYLYYIIPID